MHIYPHIHLFDTMPTLSHSPTQKTVFKNKQDSFANPRLQSLNNDCRKLPEISRKTLSIKIVGIHFSEEEWVCCHSNLSKSLENWLEGSPQSPGRASFTFCIVEGLKGFSWRFCNLDFRVMYPANKTHVWQPMCLYSCLCSLLVFLTSGYFPPEPALCSFWSTDHLVAIWTHTGSSFFIWPLELKNSGSLWLGVLPTHQSPLLLFNLALSSSAVLGFVLIHKMGIHFKKKLENGYTERIGHILPWTKLIFVTLPISA